MGNRILLNYFTQCCPTPQSEGQWKNPRDRSVPGFNDPDFWVELAMLAERGCFDSFFFADVHGGYDVYGGSLEAGIRHGVQLPGNDPVILLPMLAREARKIGFITTLSTSYYQPFIAAKVLSSLDHFTHGRVGWNIVTSYLHSACRNGLGEMLEHDERYDRADEYMDVCYKLWQRSWEDSALIYDVENDSLIDPDRVHQINHKGDYFDVEGPHMCTPTKQRVPFLVSAGQSTRGYEFATQHAEGHFVIFQNIQKAAEGAALVHELEARTGRARDSLKLLQGIGVVVAETEAEAKLKYERSKGYASVEGALALFGGWTGVDLKGYKPDDPLGAFESNQMRHLAAFFGDIDPDRAWTFADVSDYMKLVSLFPVIVGTPEQVADELERWVEVGGVHGFTLAPIDQPGSLQDFVDLVVPELQRRGRMRTSYPEKPSTLRQLYEDGGTGLIASDHPAQRVSLMGNATRPAAAIAK